MSKRDEVREQITSAFSRILSREITFRDSKGKWQPMQGLINEMSFDLVDEVFSNHNVAIVDRDAELELPVRPVKGEAYVSSDYYDGYIQAEQDMVNQGWVKEVSVEQVVLEDWLPRKEQEMRENKMITEIGGEK